jgi:hypothetical protein
MTKKPMVRITDLVTGEIVDREMTIEELKVRELDLAESVAQELKRNTAQNAKQSAQAKLAALGLTEEEVASILG